MRVHQETADELSRLVIGAAIEVHRHLGPGLLESAYQECLCRELQIRDIPFEKQVPLPVEYKGIRLDSAYRMDIVAGNLVVLELKSVERIEPVHLAQTLTYLRLSGLWLGLLINFNVHPEERHPSPRPLKQFSLCLLCGSLCLCGESDLPHPPGAHPMHSLLILLLLLPAQDNAALKDRVGQLVARLTSEDAAVRDEAEKALAALGPKALSLLPAEAPKGADDDAKARLKRVREAIEAEQEKSALEASRVTIKGKGLRLTEVLRELQRQSGNRITDLRELYGTEATNPALDLDIQDRPFFEALDIIAKKAEVTPEFSTGDGSVGLMPGAPDLPEMIGVEPTDSEPLIQYAGPFRVQFLRLGATRELATGEARANAQFNVAWEPRLRPMLLALRSEGVEIRDDRDEPVLPDVTEESANVVLRPENPIVEVNLNMEAPARAAQSLKSLKVRGEVTVPAGLRQFRFPKLTGGEQTISQGEIRLTLVSTEVDDNIWKIRVTLKMPASGPAFESYQQGLFNNRLWLQRADGSRFEHNGGFNFLSSGPGELAFEYLFVDAPGTPNDYALVYETPSRVVSIPLEFEFRDVPLP